ncbi:hypothetical protein M413DRAFT_279657 [Hebeloma cylindrosporum]|uniref:Uncharacterized protein n=1 Tax=Hebeloma cylindrosporum TaxID=76867 RepID=A0A0C3BKI8_HEBCY|nr:hypothetical protein M413DRAFT_279657 [Hebeloma cylindrosporum h7]
MLEDDNPAQPPMFHVCVTKVIEKGPEGHPKMLTWLTNWAVRTTTDSRVPKVLRTSTTQFLSRKKSVDVAPEGHARLPAWMDLLGRSFWERFLLTGVDEDLRLAVKYHHLAAISPFGPPSRRLEAAYNWTTLCYMAPSVHPRPVSRRLQSGRRTAFSQVAGMEQTFKGTTQAASLTTRAYPQQRPQLRSNLGKAEMALEWLERGRLRCLEAN